MNPLLLILLCPAVATLLIFLVPAGRDRTVRAIATVATGIALATALWLFVGFQDAPAGETVEGTSHVYKYTAIWPWVPSLGLSFHLGCDGISITLVLLTAFTIFTGVMVS